MAAPRHAPPPKPGAKTVLPARSDTQGSVKTESAGGKDHYQDEPAEQKTPAGQQLAPAPQAASARKQGTVGRAQAARWFERVDATATERSRTLIAAASAGCSAFAQFCERPFNAQLHAIADSGDRSEAAAAQIQKLLQLRDFTTNFVQAHCGRTMSASPWFAPHEECRARLSLQGGALEALEALDVAPKYIAICLVLELTKALDHSEMVDAMPTLQGAIYDRFRPLMATASADIRAQLQTEIRQTKSRKEAGRIAVRWARLVCPIKFIMSDFVANISMAHAIRSLEVPESFSIPTAECPTRRPTTFDAELAAHLATLGAAATQPSKVHQTERRMLAQAAKKPVPEPSEPCGPGTIWIALLLARLNGHPANRHWAAEMLTLMREQQNLQIPERRASQQKPSARRNAELAKILKKKEGLTEKITESIAAVSQIEGVLDWTPVLNAVDALLRTHGGLIQTATGLPEERLARLQGGTGLPPDATSLLEQALKLPKSSGKSALIAELEQQIRSLGTCATLLEAVIALLASAPRLDEIAEACLILGDPEIGRQERRAKKQAKKQSADDAKSAPHAADPTSTTAETHEPQWTDQEWAAASVAARITVDPTPPRRVHEAGWWALTALSDPGLDALVRNSPFCGATFRTSKRSATQAKKASIIYHWAEHHRPGETLEAWHTRVVAAFLVAPDSNWWPVPARNGVDEYWARSWDDVAYAVKTRDGALVTLVATGDPRRRNSGLRKLHRPVRDELPES